MLVKVTSKGQIVIPSNVRKKLNIQKGQKLVVSVKENKIILEPVENILRKGRGLLKDEGKKILEYLLEEKKEAESDKVRF